jgi:hypothetical protein
VIPAGRHLRPGSGGGGDRPVRTDAYPRCFTSDLRLNGEVSGMMSLNASGAVWYHSWRGAFISMEDS